jgi:hypothetical protein
MGKITTLAVLLALALALPAAAAVRVIAPPGNSEADQYYQTLPASTGPRAPDATKKARDAVRDGALAEATEGALRRRGPRGLALATAVAKTAPAGQPGGSGSPSSATQALPSGEAGAGRRLSARPRRHGRCRGCLRLRPPPPHRGQMSQADSRV